MGTRSDLTTDPRITDQALAQAVRELAKERDIEGVYRRAAIIAAEQEVTHEIR